MSNKISRIHTHVEVFYIGKKLNNIPIAEIVEESKDWGSHVDYIFVMKGPNGEKLAELINERVTIVYESKQKGGE